MQFLYVNKEDLLHYMYIILLMLDDIRWLSHSIADGRRACTSGSLCDLITYSRESQLQIVKSECLLRARRWRMWSTCHPWSVRSARDCAGWGMKLVGPVVIPFPLWLWQLHKTGRNVRVQSHRAGWYRMCVCVCLDHKQLKCALSPKAW